MTTNNPRYPRLWEAPPRDALLAAFEQAFARRPAVVYQTIVLKLLTRRTKEALLDTTQKRVTNMMHDVTGRFFADLERIDSGETFTHLINAIIDLVSESKQRDASSIQALTQLRDNLETLLCDTAGYDFVQAIIASIASAERSHPMHRGWVLVRDFLERWYTMYSDNKMTSTVQNAAQAMSKRTVKDEHGNVKKDAQGQPITEIVQTYTPQEISHIKLVLTLRRALAERHAAQVVTTRAMDMTVMALRQRDDDEAFARIIKAINQRCAGARIQGVIDTLFHLVLRHIPIADNDSMMLDAFHSQLLHIARDVETQCKKAQKVKHATGPLPCIQPFLLRVIDLLISKKAHQSMRPLRICLEHWYRGLTKQECSQLFTHDELPLIEAILDPSHQMDVGNQHIGMGVLLLRCLHRHTTVSTDVLLLVSLGEKAVRRLGDGSQLLTGILSYCYGTVCSADKYPVSGVLRESVFAERGGAILGWCQLVVDYVAERDKQRPGNKLPPYQKNQSCSKVNFFRGRRVAHIGRIYHLWKREEATYKEAVTTEAPVGPDAGKTLGNPVSHKELRRQHAANRRRYSTMLSHRVIGKKGARRMKKWLLSKEERKKSLKHLEILVYPELNWSDEERIAAKNAPHPYWVKRTRRGITPVRPTQFRKRARKYPQQLRDLSPDKRIKLREELREQERYAAQFEAFGKMLDHFLGAAPPAPPFIGPILPTEADMALLPPEAQLDSTRTFETYKAHFDQNLNWYYDFIPTRGSHSKDYSDEKLYDVETTQNRELEWSAATLVRPHPQPIWFKRGMNAHFKPRSFALLYYVRQQNGRACHRFIFACELVGETAEERAALLGRDRARNEPTVENFLVNYPDQRVEPPQETTLEYFATQMGSDHQERILLEYMNWRRDSQNNTGHYINTARIVSRKRTRKRTDWYVHLPVPLPTPTLRAPLDAVIGFHEHAGVCGH